MVDKHIDRILLSGSCLFDIDLLQRLKRPDILGPVASVSPVIGKSAAGCDDDAIFVLDDRSIRAAESSVEFQRQATALQP
jgi:hypothetical protein